MEKIRCVNCMNEITGSVCTHCGYKEGDTEQTGYGLKRNSILHGRYLIGNVLGQGGFGITYIGYDIALELKVAIKEYFPMGYVSRDYTQSNQIVWNTMREGQEQWKKGSENFLKEARRMAKIDVLPEIVRVRDTFMENNTSYIVMDYVEGETLKSWLLKNGTMSFTDCVKMLSPLMQSLDEVHKFGLIHRDISPDNIMVTPNGKVRLLDLGAAKDLSIESNGTSQLVTKKGFSPVEQYMERGKIGTWTDVYALSATIYYCITGKMVPEAVERTIEDTLDFNFPMQEKLTKEAEEALRMGLTVIATGRIQTVEELQQRLQKAVQPEAETERKQEKETAQKAEPASDYEEKGESVQDKEKAEPEAESEPKSKPELDEKGESEQKPEPDSKPDEFQNEPEEKPVKTKKKKVMISAVIASAAVVIIVFIVVNAGRNNKKSSEIMTDNVENTGIDVNTEAVTTMDNILMRENFLTETVLGSEISRDSIVSITFMETLDEMKDNAWDVSNKDDGSVMAWTVLNNGMYDLYIGGNGGVKGRNCKGLFKDYSNVKKIDFNNCFDTSNVTDMSYMFDECENLTELNVSGFETSSVADMTYMFEGCGNLIELNASSFDTSSVADMTGMFEGCGNLAKLDVSNFDTSNVTDMAWMFSGCKNLTELNVSSFDTSQVTRMSGMFASSKNLTELNVSDFDTSQVTDVSSMFDSCKNLTKLDVSSFDTSNVTNMVCMFFNCENLTELDVSGFNTSNVIYMSGMFDGCGITAEEAGLKTN